MSKQQRRRPASSSPQRYQRSARLGELLREVVAEELERIDDERLELVAITSIDVDPELNRGIVFFDALAGASADDEVIAAFTSHRVRLQAAIGSQIRARKTPILEFRPDEVLRGAARIEQILRDNPIPERPVDPNEVADGAGADADPDVAGVADTAGTAEPETDVPADAAADGAP